MDPADSEHIKQREVHLQVEAGAADHAQTAATLLTGADGILSVQVTGPGIIVVTYDLYAMTLLAIEEALLTVGLTLDESWIHKLQRAVYHYMEETQLANLAHSHDQSTSQLAMFANRYHQRSHGCRDERPEYYHHYN